MTNKAFSIQLKWTKNITKNVRHFAFIRTDGEKLKFTPGQFISIHFPYENTVIRRSYSIATMVRQDSIFEIALSYYKGGFASEFLFDLKPGDKLNITGPYGRLILNNEQTGRYILVATGTGIAPYRAMLPELQKRLDNQVNLQVEILHGVKKREDLLYVEDFLEANKQQPRLHFNVFYSQEMDADLYDHEHIGYVQTAYPHLNFDLVNDIIYLCGNPKMIDNSMKILIQQGFAKQHLRSEKYIS